MKRMIAIFVGLLLFSQFSFASGKIWYRVFDRNTKVLFDSGVVDEIGFDCSNPKYIAIKYASQAAFDAGSTSGDIDAAIAADDVTKKGLDGLDKRDIAAFLVILDLLKTAPVTVTPTQFKALVKTKYDTLP